MSPNADIYTKILDAYRHPADFISSDLAQKYKLMVQAVKIFAVPDHVREGGSLEDNKAILVDKLAHTQEIVDKLYQNREEYFPAQADALFSEPCVRVFKAYLQGASDFIAQAAQSDPGKAAAAGKTAAMDAYADIMTAAAAQQGEPVPSATIANIRQIYMR